MREEGEEKGESFPRFIHFIIFFFLHVPVFCCAPLQPLWVHP